MKTLSALALVATVAFTSCAGLEGPKVNMDQVYQFNDSLPTVVASISTIQTRVDENEHVKVIIGSPKLYDAAPEKKEEVAEVAGRMALRILGNGIKSGTLILTKDLQNHTEDPTDALKTDMKIETLKAAAGAKP